MTEDSRDPGVNGQADDDRASSDEDDRPLAALASEKADAYTNFYNALLNFRNHFLNEHDARYPEYTESSESEAEANGSDDFDDLSKNNMRRDRMDEATRLELASAQTRIDGKTYYTCRICGKHLSSPHTYVFHTRIHTGERPCVCHICGKQFRAPNGLQRHLAETHERRRRHACRHCDRTFANSQNLKQHIRTHTGERPYSCTLCGKRFRQSGSLHAHRKTHIALLPFRCAHCPAAFRLRAGLARHRLRHSGERPHGCELCGRAFRTRADLAAHRAAHSPARAHACPLCRAAFRSRRALRHHARRLHPPPLPPPDPLLQDDTANRSYFVLAPLYYRRCEFCPLVVGGALYNSHLLGRHADLVFHCDECSSYVARRQFLAHMTRHAHQYDAAERRAAPAPPYSPPAPAPAAPAAPARAGPAPARAPAATTTTAAADSTTTSSGGLSDDDDDDLEQMPHQLEAIEREPDNPAPVRENAAPEPNAAARPIVIGEPNPEPVQSRAVWIDVPVENPVPAQLHQRAESTAQVEETNEPQPKKTPAVRQCPLCPKTYTASSSYFYHLKYTHGQSREHECPTCGRRFGTRGALRGHAALHEPGRGWPCDQCGKRSRTQAGQYIHAQTHKGEKEKKFVCAECGRAFRWRTEFKRHVTRHAANRTHACECGRAFSVRADLLRHARTHRRAAHPCPHAGCGATFAQPRYLRAHEARKHHAAPGKAQAQRKSA